jgi:hypothetical protein
VHAVVAEPHRVHVRVTDWFRTYELPDDFPRDEAGLRARIAELLE